MKRRTTIICIIGALLIISIVALCNGKKTTFKENGITYALTVDGEKQNSFPSKGMYRVDTECSNATCKWDYENWKLYIENITGKVTCYISFTTISKTNLNNYIIGLSGTTQGTGQVVNENGYRYEGHDPNNYVWFNNEMWRIIGVFDATSHGVVNTNLVKIIRKDSLGGLAWSKSNTNNWNTASLKNLLNNEYLNSTNGTIGANCYGYSTTIKAHCDYRSSGIKDTYRGMIKEVTWYLGGHSNKYVSTTTMYGYERNEAKKISSNPASINAKIGLMYASDYGYAVPAVNCARTTSLSSYNALACTLNNWLYGNGWEWTITPSSSGSTNTFFASFLGEIDVSSPYIGYSVRPTVYLDSTVYVIDGDGSITDPYIIDM